MFFHQSQRISLKKLYELLALLQARRDWPGIELADRLGVSGRTIRRDIERLHRLLRPTEGLGARVIDSLHERLVALHAIIKKTQKTPANELTLARSRLKEMHSWPKRTRT